MTESDKRREHVVDCDTIITSEGGLCVMQSVTDSQLKYLQHLFISQASSDLSNWQNVLLPLCWYGCIISVFHKCCTDILIVTCLG